MAGIFSSLVVMNLGISFCLGLGLWTSVATCDGILPEFGPKGPPKKQPEESLRMRIQPQEEALQFGQVKAASRFDSLSVLTAREQAIVQQYTQLSQRSGGLFYNAVHQPLVSALEDLLDAQLVDGSDIVFLIDHTSSMEDDIAEIRQQLEALIIRFRAHKDVRVGMVTYSDVKSGSKYGYRAHGLSDDYESLSSFLQGIELLGSVEDVYGAIVKTVQEFSWRSKTKRLIVIISDEKPASGADTNYTEDEVLGICARNQVDTNLYPVLVDKYLPPQK